MYDVLPAGVSVADNEPGWQISPRRLAALIEAVQQPPTDGSTNHTRLINPCLPTTRIQIARAAPAAQHHMVSGDAVGAELEAGGRATQGSTRASSS